MFAGNGEHAAAATLPRPLKKRRYRAPYTSKHEETQVVLLALGYSHEHPRVLLGRRCSCSTHYHHLQAVRRAVREAFRQHFQKLRLQLDLGEHLFNPCRLPQLLVIDSVVVSWMHHEILSLCSTDRRPAIRYKWVEGQPSAESIPTTSAISRLKLETIAKAGGKTFACPRDVDRRPSGKRNDSSNAQERMESSTRQNNGRYYS